MPRPYARIARQTILESRYIDSLRAIHLSSFPPSERGDFDEWLAEISGGNK
ncbi:MAG: hypothetical protein HY327_09635 [Chloroflexi bacterium]|nr:hypothetical protein [Chloroflexota bacterium]